MSKNVIDRKAILIQDQLYDELLNGFNSEYINKGAKDSKEYKFKSNYAKRLKLVGYNFTSSEYCKKFFNDNYDFIFDEINKHKDELMNRYFMLLKRPQDDDEEEIEVKESDFNLFKIVDFIHNVTIIVDFFRTSKDLIGKYKDYKVKLASGNRDQRLKLYNQISDELKNRSKALIDSILPPTLKSVLKLYESDKIVKMWEGIKSSLLGSAAESVAWAAIGWAATSLTTGVAGFVVGGARAAVVSARIKSLINKVKKLYKVSELIYKGVKVSIVIENIIDWTKQDEEKWDKWIKENISPELEPYRQQAHEKMASMKPDIEVLDLVNQFKGDINDLFIDTKKLDESVSDESSQIQQYISGNNFQASVIPLPSGDFTVNVEYTHENVDNVLEDIYKINISKDALKVIESHPALTSMKLLNKSFKSVVEIVMKNNLYIINNSFHSFSFTRKLNEIYLHYKDILYDVELAIDDVFNKTMTYFQKIKLQDIDITERYNYKLESLSKREELKSPMWVLDNASEEQFRPLFPSKYGYLGGVYLSGRGSFTIPNEIYFHNGSRSDYDVLYYSENGMCGYKAFNIKGSELIRVRDKWNDDENEWEDVFQHTNYERSHYGYTSMMEDLFIYGVLRKKEIEVEESILKNVQTIYNIITERVLA